MKHGDFTSLAKNYAQYRPGYSPFVLDAFLGLCPVPVEQARCVDVWHAGSAESTGLAARTFHMASMASSFHWPDFDQAVKEFNRILLPGGVFMALWNTRRYESNPLLVEIEQFLHKLVPGMQRVSSGRSVFCDGLMDRLHGCGVFADVIYLEGRHTEMQTPEHYIGLWESVNDVRVQAGEERFAAFIEHIREVTRSLEHIEAEYTTRAWIARKPNRD